MPRSPLLRTFLATLPVVGALLAVLAARQGWPIPLSLLTMAVVASACAVIYWSAPLIEQKQSDTVEQSLPTAFVPHSAVSIEASTASSPALEGGSIGTRAESLATGEQFETDLLTGLLASNSFFTKLASEVTRCNEANQTAILVVCDLDAFGEINLTHGLVEGNRLLRQVADCFRLTVREGDVLSRLGGDEFGIFFPGLPPEVAETRVRDLRAAIREAGLLTLQETAAQVTACIGTASFPSDGTTVDELLAVADQAVVRAKRERQENANRPVPSALVLTRS